jgi:AAA+ ATPase superfamily predicted ATPase
MRFYGREEELHALESVRAISETSSRFTVILGRRRIGKTVLALRSVEGHPFVYLFVTRVNEPILCRNMQNTLHESGIDIAGEISRFRDILKAVMIHSREHPITLIIDEFQDLSYVNPSIYSDIQEVWDLYKDTTRLNLIVSGSVHTMMTRLFEDERQPLFNRPTSKMSLQPLPICLMKDILKDHNPGYTNKDLLTLYMLTGGTPLYIEVLMDGGAFDSQSMIDKVASPDSIFLRDGRDILVTEFGKDYRTYFSILQLIASGKERRSEIEDVLRMETGPYLDRLKKEYRFVDTVAPIFSDPDTKNTRWRITDMYLRFYFRMILPASDYLESGRYDLLRRYMLNAIPDYEGRVLEEYFTRRIREEDTYTRVGGFWNRKGDVEIDIVVVDDIERTARIIEVKRNPDKLDECKLRMKAEYLKGDLKGYQVVYQGLSVNDM